MSSERLSCRWDGTWWCVVEGKTTLGAHSSRALPDRVRAVHTLPGASTSFDARQAWATDGGAEDAPIPRWCSSTTHCSLPGRGTALTREDAGSRAGPVSTQHDCLSLEPSMVAVMPQASGTEVGLHEELAGDAVADAGDAQHRAPKGRRLEDDRQENSRTLPPLRSSVIDHSSPLVQGTTFHIRYRELCMASLVQLCRCITLRPRNCVHTAVGTAAIPQRSVPIPPSSPSISMSNSALLHGPLMRVSTTWSRLARGDSTYCSTIDFEV